MFVGADGCRAGWFAVLLAKESDWKIDVFPDVFSLWNKCCSALIILLDIPIGLREKGHKERECDRKARQLLGSRRASSVFPIPCRNAIYAESYEKANTINKQMTERGLSLQTWNIIPKIREVDTLLSNDESARLKVREIHPEICFWALAGYPMEHSKKRREGLLERIQVLKSIYPHTDDIIKQALSKYRRREVARDDIIDALSAAVTAMVGVGAHKLVSIPEAPELDSRGLRMEIVCYPYRTKCKIM